MGINSGILTDDGAWRNDGNQNGLFWIRQGTTNRRVSAREGGSAQGATPGAAPAGGTGVGAGLAVQAGYAGLAGGAHNPATGGNGANGRWFEVGNGSGQYIRMSSGAGGGGYAGGGSGSLGRARYNASGALAATAAVNGANGGRASSFLDTARGVVGAVSTSENAVASRNAYRVPGWIALSWTCA